VSRKRVLVVDDDPSGRFALRDYLEQEGHEVDEASTCKGAVAAFSTSPPDAAILDYSLPDGNALDLMPRLRALDAVVPFIVLTGHGSIDLAVQAIKEGAEQFLTKPVELRALTVILERLFENQRNRRRQIVGKSRDARGAIDPFGGTSPAIRTLAAEAERVLATDSPVLIQGETGAGKGLLAAWLHRRGPRADEAFVDLNCASLSKDLLESELFGHEKGAFTGASGAKPGLLEVAHRGTLFLDEIGDMDPAVQPKLLKVLEEQRYRRLGEVRDRHVDVRLIAATHQDLPALVQEKKFRSDLYFRVSTIPLFVPPLRERQEDIELLARQLLDGIGAEMGRGRFTLSDEAATALRKYSWPGNVRELRNVLERASLLCEGRVLEARDLRFVAVPGAISAPEDCDSTLEEVERRHIERVLRAEMGRIDPAAKRLGVPRSTLYKKIRALGIMVPRG
jgi:DNA-binding NtrC family response regulator